MAAKSVTAKSYKLPGSKGRESRIKKCPCEKGKDKLPLVRRNFIASEFKGECCEECFEITSYDVIKPEEDANNQSNKGGVGILPGTSSDNEENGRDEFDY